MKFVKIQDGVIIKKESLKGYHKDKYDPKGVHYKVYTIMYLFTIKRKRVILYILLRIMLTRQRRQT